MLHSGSRNVGNTTASFYDRVAGERPWFLLKFLHSSKQAGCRCLQAHPIEINAFHCCRHPCTMSVVAKTEANRPTVSYILELYSFASIWPAGVWP